MTGRTSASLRLRTLSGLWVEQADGDAITGLRPRLLALLAILAAAGAKGTSRERILGILWPDSSPDRARHALSQTIYNLRGDLGVDVIQSTPPNLRLDATILSSDVEDFRVASRAKDWPQMASLYVGPFLDGFYLADAPEFERWVERERAALATSGVRALEAVASELTEAQRDAEAAELWRRLSVAEPMNPRFAVAYMRTLEALGQRSAGLAHGLRYADLVRTETDAEPDVAVQDVIDHLRVIEPSRPITPVTTAPAPSAPEVAPVANAPVAPPRLETAQRRRSRVLARPVAIAASIAAVAAFGTVGWKAVAAARAPTPVLVVGHVRDLATADSSISSISSEMFATSLSRVRELTVVANSRIVELIARNDSMQPLPAIARRAGATEMLEGELVGLADGRLQLNARRVDLSRGVVTAGYQVAATDRAALFDSAAALIARDLGIAPPTTASASVSTRSELAYRLYEEGLRAYYQLDATTASRLFRAAIQEDSSFAMAMYYAWRAAVATDDTAQLRFAEASLRLASQAPERDRLLIRTHVGRALQEIASVAAADSLARRFPRDAEATARAAEIIPDLAAAIELANRSISLDSAAGVANAPICRMCDALTHLTARYRSADSLDAAERTLRRWMAFRPRDSRPWSILADLMIDRGRREDSEAAMRRSLALGGQHVESIDRGIVTDLRLDDYSSLDEQCKLGLTQSDTAAFESHRWYCTIALRTQGRYADALALVRDGRVPKASIVRRNTRPDAMHAAILDFETGNFHGAANQFARYANQAWTMAAPVGQRAGRVAWFLTLSATASLAAGDTFRVTPLADSIERLGRQSFYARDPLLHHFVRGMLAVKRGDTTSGLRELRASIHSPSHGYTRANLELGRLLLAAGRPHDGTEIVRAALHGGIEGSGLYVTRAELHELMGQLFASAGQRDSAAAHFSIVARAWQTADPALAARRAEAVRWASAARRRADTP